MQSTQKLTVIAVFTSLIIASDFALTPVYNVKLLDTLVFSSAYSFGFRIGASIAILSEFIWGVVSPNGFGGLIIPFLIAGELLYVVAGCMASKIWKIQDIKALSPTNLFFGASVAICAFIWDLETNLATGLLEGARTMWQYLAVVSLGIPFAVVHEISDFVIGAALAPIVILCFRRYSLRVGRDAQVVPVSGSSARTTSGN